MALGSRCGSLLRRPRVRGSSSSTPPSTAPQPTAAQAAVANGGYISTDPLANVRYDNRYDISLGMAYDHMKAGPTLLQGSKPGRTRSFRLVLAHQALGH